MKKDLYTKVIGKITRAWTELSRHPKKRTEGIDFESINSFSVNSGKKLRKIRKDLRNNSFHFDALKEVSIKKGENSTREVLIPTTKDRIVSRAILEAIRPKFKQFNSGCDYSICSIPDSEGVIGVPSAIRKIKESIKDGYIWVFETDIKSFFDSIPKQEILKIIERQVNDSRVFELIKQIVKFEIIKKSGASQIPDEGIAQGSSLSPLLASIYLYNFDEGVKKIGDVKFIRYVDDLVVLCKTEDVAKDTYSHVEKELKLLGLSIHKLNAISGSGKIKTRIINSKSAQFEFLGLSFSNGKIDISRKKKEEFEKDMEETIFQNHHKDDYLSIAKEATRKLEGFIKQYSKSGLYNTNDSIFSMKVKTQNLLKMYYIKKMKSIFGRDITKGLSKEKEEALYVFLGISLKK